MVPLETAKIIAMRQEQSSSLISKKSLEPKQTGKNCSPGQVTEVQAAETRNKLFFTLRIIILGRS